MYRVVAVYGLTFTNIAWIKEENDNVVEKSLEKYIEEENSVFHSLSLSFPIVLSIALASRENILLLNLCLALENQIPKKVGHCVAGPCFILFRFGTRILFFFFISTSSGMNVRACMVGVWCAFQSHR